MTGQGTGSARIEATVLSVEVRAVNHRWLEIRSRLPSELADHTAAVEETVRRTLVRGRIDVGVRLDGDGAAMPRLDVARARAAFQELTALRDALAPAEAVPLSLLGAVPGLFGAPQSLSHTSMREHLIEAAERACAAVASMRAREGATLAADFASRAGQLDGLVQNIERRVPQMLELSRRRMNERLERLMGDGMTADPLRLEQELALLADRSDVCEECTRLRSHLDQLRGLVTGEGAPELLGRRIEFLLQEMARESNTLGQKSTDLEIARAVIDLKVEIERMREQAQNVL